MESVGNTNTTIGVLGTGRIATTLAAMFTRAGHEVRIGSPDARHGLAEASVVIPAALGVQGAVQQLGPWRDVVRGKILVDVTNPFTGDHVDFVGPWATGGAEDLATAFPQARVVGAFKNVWWEAFDGEPDPAVPGICVISDDDEAKRTFLRMCDATPFSYVDAGGLDQARRVERMALSGARSRGMFAA